MTSGDNANVGCKEPFRKLSGADGHQEMGGREVEVSLKSKKLQAIDKMKEHSDQVKGILKKSLSVSWHVGSAEESQEIDELCEANQQIDCSSVPALSKFVCSLVYRAAVTQLAARERTSSLTISRSKRSLSFDPASGEVCRSQSTDALPPLDPETQMGATAFCESWATVAAQGRTVQRRPVWEKYDDRGEAMQARAREAKQVLETRLRTVQETNGRVPQRLRPAMVPLDQIQTERTRDALSLQHSRRRVAHAVQDLAAGRRELEKLGKALMSLDPDNSVEALSLPKRDNGSSVLQSHREVMEAEGLGQLGFSFRSMRRRMASSSLPEGGFCIPEELS